MGKIVLEASILARTIAAHTVKTTIPGELISLPTDITALFLPSSSAKMKERNVPRGTGT